MLKHTAILILAALSLAFTATAQDEGYQAKTANPEVTTEVLDLQLRPLMADQVEVEADAWMQLLAQKNIEISEKQIAARSAEGDARTQLNDEIAGLTTERARLVERLELATKALVERGGDAKRFEQYVAASTKLDIDATDVSGTFQFVTNWLTSEEGGIKLGINIAKFLVTLIVFSFIARILAGVVRKAMSRVRKVSDLLRDFFVNVTRKLTTFIGLIVALSMLGIDITPFVAALGAAGFVIGFALQGTLSNFASGMMILLYRPYDIGEVVTVAGTTGKVDAMTLVSTTLRLPDNQTVVIPNNSIWGDVITNITGQENRRVDMKFGCAYGDDLQKAQEVLMDIIKSHPKVLADPEPNVRVHELADSSVNFIVRPWAKTSDYWDVFWDVTRAVKDRFDKEGLNIPFPQRDVHLHQANG